MSPGTYQADFLNKRIAPFEDNKEELIGSLCYRPFVIESHHGGLEGLTDIELTEIELTLLHHASQCAHWLEYFIPLAETRQIRCCSPTSSPKTS